MANILSNFLASSPADSAAQAANGGGNAGGGDAFKAYREPMEFTNGDISRMKSGIENFYTGENAQYDSNVAKYHLAYQQAMEQGAQTDSELKKKIDENFAALEPSNGMTGEMMRRSVGGGSNAISEMREGMQNMNLGIGNALDAGVDQFGTLMQGLTGSEQVGNTIRNATDGQDLSLIPSIATDAVSFIPGVGFVLGGAKGAIESSDDIYKAFSGVDPLSLEKLDSGQRATAGAAALANVALSALPGGFAARGAEKSAAKAAGGVLKAREAEKAAATKAFKEPNKVYEDAVAAREAAAGERIAANDELKAAQKAHQEAIDNYNTLKSGQLANTATLDEVQAANRAQQAAEQAVKTAESAANTARSASSSASRKATKAGKDEAYTTAKKNLEDANTAYEEALANLRSFKGNRGIGGFLRSTFLPGEGAGRAVLRDSDIIREMRNPGVLKREFDEAAKAAAKKSGKEGTKEGAEAAKALTADEEIANVLKNYEGSAYGDAVNKIKDLIKNSRSRKFGGMRPLPGLALAQANLGLQNAADTGQGVPEAYVNAYAQAMEQGDYLPLILANFGGVKRPLGRYTGYSRTPHYIGKAGAMGDVANIENQGSVLNSEEGLAFLQTLASTGDMEKARAAYNEAMGQ